MSSGSPGPRRGRTTRPPRPGRGSAARCGSDAIQRGAVAGTRCWAMCFAYCSGRPVRPRRAQRVDDRRQVGLPAAITSLAAGVVDAGAGEVRSVERLVDDHASGRFSQARIIAVEMLRGPDHIATPDGHRRGRARPRRRRTSSAYSSCSRSTTGPRAPLPIVRPSTVRTGHDAGERPGHERLVGAVDVGEAERRLPRGDAVPRGRPSSTLPRVIPPRQ